MTLHRLSTLNVPEETARVARAIYPEGNLAMAIRDRLYCVYDDQTFVDLYPGGGQPAESAWRLALVTVLQMAEGLSDRQAVDAVRDRVSWKYLLGLELTATGFDASVLSEFRTRLVTERVEYRLLNGLLRLLEHYGLLKMRGQVRTDATHVEAAIRTLNRLTLVGETLRHALNELATLAPDWLRRQVDDGWYERYGRRVEDYHLPKVEAERQAVAQTIGQDGLHLLSRLAEAEVPPAWHELAAVEAVRQVWSQQYEVSPDGRVRWRNTSELPAAAQLIQSPYDLEARHCVKRDTEWVGYKVHLTETCDEDKPHLITHVHTTLATTVDEQAIEPIHEALQAKGLLPSDHLLDAAYVDSIQLVESQSRFQVNLVGPIPANTSWQAQAGQGFAASDFDVDWQAQTLTCPAGHRSIDWKPIQDRNGNPVIRVHFSRPICDACPLRVNCTRAKSAGREVTIHHQPQYVALQAARQRQTTDAFKAQYAARAGIEGTLAQGISLGELRRSRYRGLQKTRLHHILIAVAINLIRVVAWFNDIPWAPTRLSSFAALAHPI